MTNTIVVGQWLGEIDSLDLAEDDSIAHIRTWYSQDHAGDPDEFGKVIENTGKMVGIQISTARGLCKEVHFDGSRDTHFVDYYTNQLQDLVSHHA